MADVSLALAPERRAGWAAAVGDAGGLVTATVPAVPGIGVPVLDSIMPLVSSFAWIGEKLGVVVELLDDEELTNEVVTAVMRELAAAEAWSGRSCPREGPDA